MRILVYERVTPSNFIHYVLLTPFGSYRLAIKSFKRLLIMLRDCQRRTKGYVRKKKNKLLDFTFYRMNTGNYYARTKALNMTSI
ncbi:hypothetical protein D915_007562 [Fasciola hepatica]|uniref:Uncharacterized protein n=1 Tax=Fasciola hepatica TaxID=6192 RepID=A0A4E0R2C1_FASHE|nr:hypothetical protein D915_007562 [Fasciola hepatica]